jgi:branched-chain amino acid transport system substrate-binding protein
MTMTRYCLIAAAMLSLAACGNRNEAPGAQTAAANERVVEIGHVAPITGDQGHLGKDNENGAQLAIDELNAEGVVIGGQKIKFELMKEDDQHDPKQAPIVAQRFVDAQVAGVIGHLNSGTTIPASAIYSAAGIPEISPSATNPVYTHQGFKTAFRVIANDVAQGAALGKFVADNLHAKKVAIIDDQSAYGKGLADEFEKAAKAEGVAVIAREAGDDKTTDFSSILTKIKSERPDMVFYGGMDAQAGPLARQLQKLGIDARLIGGDGFQTPEFVKLAGDNAEGQYASQPGTPKDKMPGYADFNKKYQDKYHLEIQNYAAFTYDAVMVMAAAMKKADSTEPAKYLPELAKTNYNGVTGNIQFDANGDLLNGAVTVYQVKNGQWESVATVGASPGGVE